MKDRANFNNHTRNPASDEVHGGFRVLRLSWPRKILLYSTLIVAGSVFLTAIATVRTAAHLWEEEFLERNSAYARYTSLDVLRAFGGQFAGGTDPRVSGAVANITRGNEDLLGIMILTESGRALFSTPGWKEDLKTGAWPHGADEAVQAVVGSTEPVARSFQANGQRYLDVLSPVTDLGGVRPVAVRYLFGYSSLDLKTADLVQRVVLVSLGLMVMVAALSAFLSRGLTRPVSILTSSARRIAEGDRDLRIQLSTGDEIEELSLQFNNMLQSLAEHRSSLEEANRELREANLQLTDLQAQLIRSERLAALGQLSAGVSHELDNPIGVIMGYAELLMEEAPSAGPLGEYAVVIRDEAKRCKRIIAGLLDFSRPSRGTAELVDLKILVTKLVDQLREQRPFRRIAWDMESTGRQPVVRADPDSLRQVLVNLILNASQSMGGEGTITVAILEVEVEGIQGYLIRIGDTGSGVPEGMEERVFDPFYTTKRRGEGTGLGLSICRKLVEEADGWARCVPGPDGAFEIWLPIAGSGAQSSSC
ncbi:MAG: HAMP domain-containing sensor histidine kinase [bacterium]|nr:HAMP domain-containing sensor histidine kinase [bacterium]MDT8395003.1 HAMP domain-containing sensor histidine kinase [bacterium]